MKVLWTGLSFSVLVASCATTQSNDEQPKMSEENRAAFQRTCTPIPADGRFFANSATLNGHQGCAIFTFGLTEDGQAKDFQILYSAPDNSFGQAEIDAVQRVIFERQEHAHRYVIAILSGRNEPESGYPKGCNAEQFARAGRKAMDQCRGRQ